MNPILVSLLVAAIKALIESLLHTKSKLVGTIPDEHVGFVNEKLDAICSQLTSAVDALQNPQPCASAAPGAFDWTTILAILTNLGPIIQQLMPFIKGIAPLVQALIAMFNSLKPLPTPGPSPTPPPGPQVV